jgi:carbamoyltransferase
MLILGLNLGHDPSAALLDDRGIVLAAAHEARLSRLKKERRFPHRAIGSVLRATGRQASEVTVVAYSSYEADSLRLVRDKYLCGVGALGKSVRELIRDELGSLGLGEAEVVREDHHFAHACGAQLACETGDALIVTCDGYGDGVSFTVRHSQAGRVPESAAVTAPIDSSLGLVYQYVTGGLGYPMLSEEWKVLGLEPRGAPAGAAELFDDLIDGSEGIGRWSGEKLAPWSLGGTAWEGLPATERRNALRRYMELNVSRFDRNDVAAGVQRLVESRLVAELERLEPRRGTSLALAGGTFLNVKLNRLLAELDWVENVSVFPAAGDGGNAVGAALAHLQRVAPEPPRHGIESIYWGECHADEVARECSMAGLESHPVEEAEAIAALATAAAEGRIVAIARGRSEFGPRALLNRSLVCRADRPELAALITRGLRRDPVMPYGCSMLAGEAEAALESPAPLTQCLRFMVAAPLVKREFGRRYEAFCHPVGGGDLSTRPQVVADGDSWQARFLRAVGAATGGAVVLNTSFNLHGEPIVETPADALDSFRRAAFPESVLLLEDRIVTLAALERMSNRPARPVPLPRTSEPRRRYEASICLVSRASAGDLASLKRSLERLGLRVLAERAMPEETPPGERGQQRQALLVAGSEAPAMLRHWTAGLDPTVTGVEIPASNVEEGKWIRDLFPDEAEAHAGAFADLLLWPSEAGMRRALDLLGQTTVLALAGLLYEPAELLGPAPEEEPLVGSEIGAVFGTAAEVPPPLGGRMYLYAPEGRLALGQLVRLLDRQIRGGDFLRCREGGLVLAYCPPSEIEAPLEEILDRALEWEIDALVAVHPSLDASTAEHLERLARERDLAILGGSDCAISARSSRPLGVGSGDLGRFLNRFPGLEL